MEGFENSCRIVQARAGTQTRSAENCAEVMSCSLFGIATFYERSNINLMSKLSWDEKSLGIQC